MVSSMAKTSRTRPPEAADDWTVPQGWDGYTAQDHALYLKVKDVVKADGELCAAVSLVFPNWAHVRELADSTATKAVTPHSPRSIWPTS